MSIASEVSKAANRSDFRAMNTYDKKDRRAPKAWKKVARVELIFWDGTVINVSRSDFDMYCRDITFSLGQIDSPEAKRNAKR